MQLARPAPARPLRATLTTTPLTRRPWSVLLALALAQWLLLLLLTRRIVHNGWLFAQSGRTSELYSAAWSFAHGHLAPALTGYGWPLVTAPIAGLGGVNVLDALPSLVVLQVLVLLPLALLAVYGVAARIGGRWLGYASAVTWVLIPYVVHPLFSSGYHATYVQQLLPQALGLTALDAFPSTVCVLAAAFFTLASIDSGDPLEAALGGLFAGFAVGIDAGNVLFLPAPAVGYLLARRWRPAGFFGLALLPALATLALWQWRGSGHLPHIHAQIDLHHLRLLSVDFRSAFYSDRLVEIPFLAGVIAIGRRSWVKSAFVAAWFLSYVLVRGSAPGTTIGAVNWYGAFMPAFPAFVIAVCALPLLVPRLGERLADAPTVGALPRLAWSNPGIVAAAVAFALVPFVVVAALPDQKRRAVVAYTPEAAIVPVDPSFQPQAVGQPGAVVLRWPQQKTRGATSFYVILRSAARPDDIACPAGGGRSPCPLAMLRLGSTNETTYLDIAPPVPPGRWRYRVGVAANLHSDPNAGGLTALSAPVDVTVP